MFAQLLLATEAFAAEAAETTDAVTTALDTPATGHVAAFAIAIGFFLVIGSMLFYHRWSQRRVRQ